ncbi:MAG: hypothetical protein JW997_02590 [Actinobacteria bacterium]|nr:hypothetical protein [Actinomycetota bacterium]
MKRFKKITIVISAVLFIAFLLVPTTSLFAQNSPEVWAKKTDYRPGSQVMIVGEGFEANTCYTVEVIRPDGSIVKGDGSEEPGSDTVTTDKKGAFKYKYRLEKISDDFDPEGIYKVNVYDGSGSCIAGTEFIDGTVRW